MITQERLEKLHTIIEHYGYEKQIEQFVEECAEAILAVQKVKRIVPTKSNEQKYTEAVDNLHEEVADVLIMAIQMYCLINSEKVDRIIDEKLNRQIERIKHEE